MATIRSFRDLDVWQASMVLAEDVYRVTDLLPSSERFGMAGQIRRAAASIPANVAEGHVRTPASYRHHVSIAIGSHAELDTLLELASRLHLLDEESLAAVSPRLAQTGQLLHGLARALHRRHDAYPRR